jgi:uncharacterized protein involved in type VI secretion and phage assembly
MSDKKFYGKYRAKIVEVDDPEERGRIKVIVPSVTDKSETNWCDPCIPVAYDDGGDFSLPTKGETVWVEFEEGDINKPIWTGNWFSKSKTPIKYPDIENQRVISFGDSRILMNKETKEMTLLSGTCKIVLDKNATKINLICGGSTLVLNADSIGKLNQLILKTDDILTHITHPID